MIQKHFTGRESKVVYENLAGIFDTAVKMGGKKQLRVPSFLHALFQVTMAGLRCVFRLVGFCNGGIPSEGKYRRDFRDKHVPGSDQCN